MGRISGYGADNSPVSSDFLLGEQSSGPGTVRFPMTKVGQAIGVSTRKAQMFMYADQTGGASLSQLEANDVSLTAATNYLRASVIVPQDYVAGTNATILLYGYAASSNNMATTYYMGSHFVGQVFASWNVFNNVTGSALGFTVSNQIYSYSVATITSANLGAGYYVTMAFRINSAPTGTVVFTQALLQYTSQL